MFFVAKGYWAAIESAAASDARRIACQSSKIGRNATPNLTGDNVIAEVFKIGNRVFVRRLYASAYNASVDLPKEQKDDWCRVVEPGPPLGLEGNYPSVAGQDLPAATVKLPQVAWPGRRAP